MLGNVLNDLINGDSDLQDFISSELYLHSTFVIVVKGDIDVGVSNSGSSVFVKTVWKVDVCIVAGWVDAIVAVKL